MRIHITTIAPELAAVEIMNHMQSHGGEWIVNAVEKEGYILARGAAAKQLLRSGSQTLVGSIDATVSLGRLHGLIAIAHAKSLSEAPRKRKKGVEDKPSAPLKPGTQQRVLAELRERNWAVRELADHLGVSRSIAMNAVQKLLKSKRAVIVQRIDQGARKPACIYGAAT